jgi:nitroreductase
MDNKIIAANPSGEVLDYLLKRRSCPVKTLGEPGPDRQQIETILKVASRVPDHGKMFPWYFVVFEGDARREVGTLLRQAWLEEEPEAAEAKLELEEQRFLRAPVVIGVISRVREGKHPAWEQFLSAGAVCQNLCLAANASGFGTHWMTEWYSYNDTFRSELGLDEYDHAAGFIYIGTPDKMPEERDRPGLNEIVTYWDTGVPLKKGETYGRKGMGYPRAGFCYEEKGGEKE